MGGLWLKAAALPIAITSAVSCLAPPEARGATAYIRDTCKGGTGCIERLYVRAAKGERNRIVVEITQTEVFITDEGAPLQAGHRCENLAADRVVCDDVGQPRAYLGDRADSFTVAATHCSTGVDGRPYCGGAEVYAGPGSDVLTGNDGDDYFDGNSGRDRVYGQGGPDHVGGGVGEDQLQAGEGADRLVPDEQEGLADDSLDGGAGVDIALYGSHLEPIRADLGAGIAGSAGERDRLVDIEALQAGQADDVLIADGRSAYNLLDGWTGDDSLRGGSGRDVLMGSAGSDTLVGGAGDDDLLPSGLSGWPDAYVWYPRDYVWGGGDTEGASDEPHVIDDVDRISCGPGSDLGTGALARDVFALGCETVEIFGAYSDKRAQPRYHLLGEIDSPRGAIVRLTGVYCPRRSCRSSFRMVLARRAGSTPAGTVVGRRAVRWRSGENPPTTLRLSRRGRSIVSRYRRAQIRLLVSGYGASRCSSSICELKLPGFSFEIRRAQSDRR